MKRYLSRERVLTPEERKRIHDAAVEEAREEYAAALENLKAAIAAKPPTTETEYVEVKPGEPGYDDAPFENSIIMDMRDSISTLPRSPWLSMIERGKFPGGLGSH